MSVPTTSPGRAPGAWRLIPTLLMPVVTVAASAMACERVVVWLIVGAMFYAWGLSALLGIQLRSTAPATRPWQMSIRRMLLLVAVVCCVLSVLTTDWPLHLRFALSRPAIEVVADRLQQGEPLATPTFAGLFWIRKAEINRAGQPCLWIRVQPGGSTGLVRCRANALPELNLASSLPMGDGWYLIAED